MVCFSTLCVFVIFIVILVWLIYPYLKMWYYIILFKFTVPCSKPHFFVRGLLRQERTRENFVTKMDKYVKKYGDCFVMYKSDYAFLVINNADICHEILTSDNFQNKPACFTKSKDMDTFLESFILNKLEILTMEFCLEKFIRTLHESQSAHVNVTPLISKLISQMFATLLMRNNNFKIPDCSSTMLKTVSKDDETYVNGLTKIVSNRLRREQFGRSKWDWFNFCKNIYNKTRLKNAAVLSDGCDKLSYALNTIFYVLATQHDAQDKVYTDIVANIAAEDHLSFENVQKLHYLDMVISEILRLYPFYHPFNLWRVAEKDTRVRHIWIPKGGIVMFPVWKIHRDPRYWPNPLQFNPERFSPKNKDGIKAGSFVPFGIGPKSCIAKKMAETIMKVLVAQTIRNFQLRPIDNNFTDIAKFDILETVEVKIKFIKRSPPESKSPLSQKT